MPQITTLIPAYKPEYLGEVFQGLLQQNCRDFQVILADDSPGDRITQLLREGHYGAAVNQLDIQCVRGPKNARLNMRALIDLWGGCTPYVHVHLDDDVIFPDFYRAHLEAHATGRFSASVSRRWMSRGDARPTQGFELPAFIARSPLHHVTVDAPTLFQSVLPGCDNWVGEFSNMLLSAEGAAAWPRPRSEPNYFGWPDVGFVLEAVQRAPLVLLREHLSVFRHHAAQSTHHMNNHTGRVSSLAWAVYALLGWKQGRIGADQAVRAITLNVRRCMERFGESDSTMNAFYDIVQRDGRSLEGLYASMMAFWVQLLAQCPSTAPVDAPAPVPLDAALEAVA